MTQRSIVITGMSAWTCFGRGVPRLIEAIREGRRAPRAVEGLTLPVSDPWFKTREAMQIRRPESIGSRFAPGREVATDAHSWPTRLAVETALDAVVDAGHPQRGYAPARIAVCNGTSHGSNHGLLEYLRQEHVGESPEAALLADTPAIIAAELSTRLGACGLNLTFNTACSAGVNAIGQGLRLLERGLADCVLAGAHDTFSFLSYAGFTSLKALDPRGCRPFDEARAGLSLGDGAAYCVLERESAARARGARVLARVTGYGYAGEAYHPTAPDPEGDGAARVMAAALRTDPAPRELDLVSAHGTGTPANDAAELRAIERVIKERSIPGPVRVASLKSQTGHGLGAAGAIQLIAAVACLNHQVAPANVGLTRPIPHGPTVALPTAPSRSPLRLALCNAFGFGGSVASIAIRRADAEDNLDASQRNATEELS